MLAWSPCGWTSQAGIKFKICANPLRTWGDGGLRGPISVTTGFREMVSISKFQHFECKILNWNIVHSLTLKKKLKMYNNVSLKTIFLIPARVLPFNLGTTSTSGWKYQTIHQGPVNAATCFDPYSRSGKCVDDKSQPRNDCTSNIT